MVVYDYNQWLSNPNLKHWQYKSSVGNKCNCNQPTLVELINQDFCIRGSIDTVVCTSCDNVYSLKISR